MESQVYSKQWLDVMQSVKSRIQDLEGFSTQEFDEVVARLVHRSYLIAVFGAFSAGKSSLLNALLSDPILAVSPNPTTASVTRIRAPKEESRIEAVTITAKTEEELWRDVSNAFDALHEAPASLTEAMMQASVLSPRDYPTSVRSHIRFLKSVANGYDEMLPKLGQSWTTSIDDLERFTADEKQAAYIARVDVARNNPWLNHGFIFVDTPGVDSIHRRHTDVAFRYMRHADAVLFVMYYTHAFTQRDRDFLLQLSGVQDVTDTNKLFTVVNAVDLAASDDERVAVRKRIDEELRRLGIREPRVYEVSSQLALAGRALKENPEDEAFQAMAKSRSNLSEGETLPSPESLIGSSGIVALETDLRTYIESEGSELARDIVIRTLRQIRDQVHRAILDTQASQAEDEDMRNVRLEKWSALEDEIAQELESATSETSGFKQGFIQHLQELVFHAGQRIRFRYRDLFRASFHPGRFRIGRTQDKLQEAAAELTDSLSRQIDIEVRTFSLRAAQLVREKYEQTVGVWRDKSAEVSLNPPLELSLDTDDLVAEDVQTTLPSDLLRPYFRYFSSAKHFFEEGGSKSMMDATESPVMENVQQTLERSTEAYIVRAWTRLAGTFETAKASLFEEIQRVRVEADRPFDQHRLDQLEDLETFLNQTNILFD